MDRYLGQFRQFAEYCRAGGVPTSEILPADPSLVAPYIAHLSSRGLAPSSLRVAEAAISWVHRISGHPSPVEDRTLHQVSVGAQRLAARPVASANPLGPDMLELTIVRLLEEGSMPSLRLAAMIKITYGGFLRVSETLAIKWCHLSVRPGNVLAVFLPRRKNDQAAAGQTRVMPGDLQSPTGALSLLLLYAQALSHPFPSGDQRTAWPSSSPGGSLIWDRPLPRQAAYDELALAFDAAGIDSNLYKWHSLRAGPATSAGDRGVPEAVIMAAGGWRSASAARGYIHLPAHVLVEASGTAMAPHPLAPPLEPFQPRPPSVRGARSQDAASEDEEQTAPHAPRRRGPWGPNSLF